MEEMNRDKIEKLMQSKLQDYRPADNNWNVPPDGLFDQVASRLPEEKKRKNRAIFFIIPLLFGLAVASNFIIHTNQKIKKIHTELNAIKEQQQHQVESQAVNKNINPAVNYQSNETKKAIKKLNESEWVASNELIEQAQLSAIVTPPLAHQTSSSSQSLNTVSPTTSPVSDEHDRTSHSARIFNSIQEADKRTSALSILPSEKNVVTTGSDIPIQENKKSNSCPLIPMHAMDQLKTEVTELHYYPLVVTQTTNISKINTEDKLSIFAFAGGNLSTLCMKNVGNNSFSLTGYDQDYWGYQGGFGASYALTKKFRLMTELSYSHYTNRSVYRDQSYYQTANEQTDTDGSLMYVTDMKMESPMHKMEELAKFKINDSHPQQDDLLNNKTSFYQRINTIGLSVGLEHDVFEFSKWKLHIGAGINGQYIHQLNEKMDMKIYHEGKTMMSKSKEISMVNEINRTIASAYGSLGLSYNLNKNLSVRLSGSYFHSFNSIRVTRQANDPVTYLNSLRLSVGGVYQF
jgi:opacity protein-like surface antigen